MTLINTLTKHGQSETVFKDNGRLGNGIDGLYERRGGKLWAGSPDVVWRWKSGPQREPFITTLDGIKTLVNEHAGHTWLALPVSGRNSASSW